MKLAVTGGTGLVGRFLVEGALADGHSVTVMSRRAPAPGFFSSPVAHRRFALGEAPDLTGAEAVIHAAFDHVPGRYRGGEGEDPDGFRHRNLAGSRAVFEAARAAKAGRFIFLSSRAVYGSHAPGIRLTEETLPRPDTLYGKVKLEAEQALVALLGSGIATVSLRCTGVYGPPGPGQRHKWHELFDDFRSARAIEPRVGTEVHGTDLWRAIRLLLTEPSPPQVANVSDILLDRRDLLRMAASVAGWQGQLPKHADADAVNAMDTTRLGALGWTPGGIPLLKATLPALIRD
ncbi:NAD-dependent epimerase/dehydratase family protein [Roseitranquillus sediminis]|uniref:NAD-dependent epimerase/dehydratase family protein n=1 Tax=Roseitranquillus sediminis TaxID=2809051 RepID=UPI001D0C792F|nr:NAD(P)-dependent oxidoreductase [Roseitranquillus sediminis]MBM9594860.1 NAD(P)-dependent oxidoreductase [Roseitranquillus sediminis]